MFTHTSYPLYNIPLNKQTEDQRYPSQPDADVGGGGAEDVPQALLQLPLHRLREGPKAPALQVLFNTIQCK